MVTSKPRGQPSYEWYIYIYIYIYMHMVSLFNDMSIFGGYLNPKPSISKDSSGTSGVMIRFILFPRLFPQKWTQKRHKSSNLLTKMLHSSSLATTLEVGCRGFLGHSVISFLSKIAITARSLEVASNCLQTAAQYAWSWIWSKARSFQHEENTRGTTIPVWLHKKTVTVNA